MIRTCKQAKERQEIILAHFREGQVIPAIPLCLDEKRQFDEHGQRRLIQYYLEAGAGGIAIAVHTTQFEIRDPEIDLFETVLRLAADEISAFEARSGRMIIKVSGVCGDDEQATREATVARDYDFDLVLLSPGGRQNDSEASLLQRTKLVAEIMPVIGFSMQVAVGGRLFSYEYWQEMVGIPNLIGIKGAPFNRYETINIARAAALSGRGDELVLYTGNDDNIIVDLLTPFSFWDEAGERHDISIKGGLLGQWSVWTRAAVRIFQELKEIRQSGQTSIPIELLTQAAWLTEANGAVFDYRHNFAGVIPGVHQALVDDGQMAGIWTLNEEETLSPGQADEIRRTAGQYSYIRD